MQARLDLITVAVDDFEAARRFYVIGLGWTPALEVPDEILFLQLNRGLLLALWGADDLAQDIGLGVGEVIPGAGFSLAHNVDRAQAVDQVVADARAAGATILRSPRRAPWGGYSGYFADPNGIRWEVAYNPNWRVDENGRVRIGPVE